MNLSRERAQQLAELIRSDTPRGFEAFYTGLYGRPLPRHARRWIQMAYWARAQNKGIVIKAFRGSTKTTTITNAFAAYRTLCEPDKNGLLLQVADGIAKDNSSIISKIVEHAPIRQVAWPYIGPSATNWGAGGYDIVRLDMPFGEFQSQRLRWGKDNSFIGLGYGSSDIIGKHPSSYIIVDDINNERNTASHRRLAEVNKIVTDTIYPTTEPNFPWEIWIGTPWVHNDVLTYVESTGQYVICTTPVYKKCEESDPEAVWCEWEQGHVKLAWPDGFPMERVERARKKAGLLGFARMYLLDLMAASGKYLKTEWLHEYPSEDISSSWPVAIGVDFATVADKLHTEDRDRFALAVGRLIPGGGIVLVDGWVGHLTRGDAELKVQSFYERYSPLVQTVGIDVLGKGELFYDYLLHNTNLPVFPCKGNNMAKGTRFEDQLAPMFQFGRAFVSDEYNAFINEFKGEWGGWQAGAPFCDTIDAVYYMCQAGQGNLMPSLWELDDQLPGVMGVGQEPSPFNELGAWNG